MMKYFKIKIIGLVGLVVMISILFCPDSTFARRIRPSLIDEFLRKKEENINIMVTEIMTSERGIMLVEELRMRLKNYRRGNIYILPIKIEGIMAPAGHGFEYKVNIHIAKKDGFISVVIYGDTEPEGYSEDPSCWDRSKVIIRCVIAALKKCGLQIKSEPIHDLEDSYWYSYYYTVPSD